MIYGGVCGEHHESRHKREVEGQVARQGRSMEDHPRPRISTTASTATARKRDQAPRPHLATDPAMRKPPHLARPPRATRKRRRGPATRSLNETTLKWFESLEPVPVAASTPTSARQRASSLRSTSRPRLSTARRPCSARGSGSFQVALDKSTRVTSRSNGRGSASRTGSYPSRREAHQRAPGAHPRPACSP
jgi:hypothetical protein